MTVKTSVVDERSAQAVTLVEGGFVLVPLAPRTKVPQAPGWNNDPDKWLTTAAQVFAYFGKHPEAGVGLLHGASGTAALDIDHDHAADALMAVGIDLAELLQDNPYQVQGARGVKPIWRMPEGVILQCKALNWPSAEPDSAGRSTTLFELRGGGVQDVLPPSIHPRTGQAYTWVGPVPQILQDLPILPPELLHLWQWWPLLEQLMKAACPWQPDVPSVPLAREIGRYGSGGDSVIDAFNRAVSLADVLTDAGYRGDSRGRWLYPGSSSGRAGVRQLPYPSTRGHPVVLSFHTGDPLSDGRPHDAFGIWSLLKHHINLYTAPAEHQRKAVALAARHLNLPEPQRSSTRSTPVAWGQVKPLPPLTERVPAMPAEMLPPSLAAWVKAEARAAGTALESMAVCVVVGAAGMINGRLLLKNAPNFPALPANLWGAICEMPGTKKSHVLSVGAGALHRVQKAEADRVAALRPSLEAARDIALANKEVLKGQLKRVGGDSPPPSQAELAEANERLQEAEAALRPKRYYVIDSTVEMLGEILQDNPDGVVLTRDELQGWFAGFNKKGREQERSFYLEAANGNNPYTFDRISRGTVHIPRVCVGVMGGLQPKLVKRLVAEQRVADDGLLQRLQVFVWPDDVPPFDQCAQREPISDAVREAAQSVCDRLLELSLVGLGSVSPSGDAVPLTYSPEAQDIYDTWEREHARQVRASGCDDSYRAHISKQTGTFARLALTFHALEVAAVVPAAHPCPSRVGVEAALLAQAWCEYLTLHARKLWDEGRRQDVSDARIVVDAIGHNKIRDGQKVAEVRRILGDTRQALSSPRLNAALQVLADCGAVEVQTPDSGAQGGRPSPVLRVHPEAIQAWEGEERP